MTAKPNAFDGATFYECLDRDSELSHTTVAEAIEAAIDNAWEGEDDTTDSLIAKIAPVEVTAWIRRVPTRQHIDALTIDAFDTLEENAEELFGDPEGLGSLWSGSECDAIRKELTDVVRYALTRASIYQCDVVGKRSYAAAEIAAILTGETI